MRIELSEVLGEGQYVEVKDPKKLSWRKQKEIASALQTESIASQLDVAELVAIELISGGYVLDADNKPVTFPLTLQNVGDCPGVVIEEVAKFFAEEKSKVTPKN